MSALRHVFLPFPSPNIDAYTTCLDKVEKIKTYFWKDQVIYESVKISRMALNFNPNMSIAAILLWEGYTNTFQQRCRMVTPNLFDIVVIVGLFHIRETFDPTLITNTKPVFDFDLIAYKNFVKDFHETGF